MKSSWVIDHKRILWKDIFRRSTVDFKHFILEDSFDKAFESIFDYEHTMFVSLVEAMDEI